jgi:O-antigen/teichoic acid export membrane protein
LIALCGAFIALHPGEHLGADDAMQLHAVAALIAFAIGAVLFLRARPAESVRATPVYRSRPWLRAILPLALAGGMQALIRSIDVLVLGIFQDDKDVAIYRAAVQTSLLVSFGLTAFDQAVAPQYAALYAKGDMRTLQRAVAVVPNHCSLRCHCGDHDLSAMSCWLWFW